MEETLRGWGSEHVFIKGANAVDPEFNAGIFNAHPGGGTIGFAYGMIAALGIPLIVPVGLEKLVPSVKAAANELGHDRVGTFTGVRFGMFPLYNATVVTEIQALETLCGVRAVHVGGGGVAGSEGSVVVVVEGESDRVEAATELVEGIKGEPPIPLRKAFCATSVPSTPMVRGDDAQLVDAGKHYCIYGGRAEDQLPE